MHLFRRPVARALLLALLFGQIVTAAYACTAESATSTEGVTVAASASSDCEGMQMPVGEPASPSSPLCVNHCTHATDAPAYAHLPALHWLPVQMSGPTIVAPMPGDVDQLVAWSASPSLAHAVEPPIPILLGRFLS